MLAKFWSSRQLWGAKVPILAALFELLDVFGFSPSLLAEWVRRRSWYRQGQDETGRIRKLWPGAVLFGAFLLLACGCSGSPMTSCPIPNMTRATLPAALTLVRSVMTLAEASCGSSCPSEWQTARTAVDSAEATAEDVCRAIPIVRLVPCEQCLPRLDELSSLLACEASP
ncbi:MAG: hypothetical protein WC083_07925 [Candidatus Methanomethylophilaceae archaeon]